MGFSILVTQEPEGGTCLVTVRVQLTNAESSKLFLAGDVLLSWPPVDCPAGLDEDLSGSSSLSSLNPATCGPALAPFERTSMFVSEAARLPQGLRLRYRKQEYAVRVAGLLRRQLLEAGVLEEV